MAEKELTAKQIRFCQEYIIDLIGSQAAVRAEYSEDTAASIASELLTKPNIQAYVQELMDDRATRTRATADKVVSELYHLISYDPNEIYDTDGTLKKISNIPKNIRKAIASIEVTELFSGSGESRTWIGYTKKIKLWDKTKVLEMLARHHKLLTDVHELGGPGGAPLAAPQIFFESKKNNE